MTFPKLLRGVALLIALTGPTFAHEGHDHAELQMPAVKAMELRPERKALAKGALVSGSVKTSGEGAWKFVAVPDLLPLPEVTKPHIKGAHGTMVWDRESDTVYWGLQNLGWVAFTDRLTQGRVINGDAKFSKGNLHGADLMPRRGRAALIAVADDVENEVYLTDTTFARAEALPWPQGGPYTQQKEFKPTDAAFTKQGEVYVTDGYGKAFFMPARTEPFEYQGRFIGGKKISQTPHGITFDQASGALLIAARPEGQIQRWSAKKETPVQTVSLPAGSTVCDVDVWEDYVLAPCLNGPNKTPGPIYIVNMKKQTIASVIRPKEDLGFTEAQHIHDAIWYVTGRGSKREVYILFTNWNPGGVGALKLVRTE